jgi:TRAP-type transport system periplasmic protein
MSIARRALLTSMAASLAGPAVLRLARAETPQVTLKLHHFFSSVSSAHADFLAPWARKVEAESGGRIRIELFPSMQLGGAPEQLFDQARDGVADIVWMAPSNTPGRFPRAEVFELPFVPSGRALVNSKALQDYAAANLQDEFREIHPLSFSCRDHGVVHANRIIRSIADFKGLRLHVPNRLAGETVQALGGQAVSAPILQVPMAISGRVIDGCLDPWDVVPSLRLHELLKAHTDFAASSLSTMTMVLAMNKAAYDRLPRELKTVIDNNAGQVVSGMAGAMWDGEAKAVADMVRGRGDPIITLTAEEVALWRKAIEPVIAAWQKEMKAHKTDGAKLMASAHALLAKYANEPEPLPSRQPPEPKATTTQPQQPPQPKVSTQPRQTPELKVTTQPPLQPATPPPQPTTEPQQSLVPAPKVVTQPPLKPAAAKAVATEVPKASVTPVVKPAPKELDIPL